MKNLLKTSILFLGATCIISCDPEEESAPNVDLAVTDISFAITGVNPAMQDFEGTATITATVTNVGTDAYVSEPGQQGVLLYEDDWYLGSNLVVADQEFTTLEPGQTVTVTYSRTWNQSSPNEGEFPPSYRAVLTFDPDIYIDGLETNDDNVSYNNERTENGAVLNQ